MNGHRPFEMIQSLVPIPKERIGLADVVQSDRLASAVAYGAPERKGFVKKLDGIGVVAEFPIYSADVIGCVSDAPLIVRDTKNFQRLLVKLKCVLAISEAIIRGGNVVEVGAHVVAPIQFSVNIERGRIGIEGFLIFAEILIAGADVT